MTQTIEPSTIRITEAAAIKVRYFAEKQGLSGDYGVKVGVKGGGCSGLTYTLSIEPQAGPDDKVVEQEGVRVFVPKKSYVFLAGTELDFSDGLNGKGFTFSNPNAKSTCGCGSSFST